MKFGGRGGCKIIFFKPRTSGTRKLYSYHLEKFSPVPRFIRFNIASDENSTLTKNLKLQR